MESKIMVGTADGLHQLGPQRDVWLETHEITWLAQDGSSWWASPRRPRTVAFGKPGRMDKDRFS